MDTNRPGSRKFYAAEPDALNEHLREPGDPDGLVAAEKQRMWREGMLAMSPNADPTEMRKRYWPTVLIVLTIVAVAMIGAYFLGMQKARVPIAKKAQIAQNKAQRQFAPVTTATKHYDSSTYALALDYPDNWMIADTKTKLTITSPAFAMTGLSGATDGHVLITIQNQQTSISGYPGAGATASLVSDTITYKQPSNIQRSASYLSFLGYTNSSGIDALYLTGDRAYEAGDVVPMADIAKGTPLISVRFVHCAKSYCASGSVMPLTLQASSWKNATFKPPVVSTLQSLVLN